MVISPDLTPNEVRRLRSLLHESERHQPDKPWESGLIDHNRPRGEVEVLRERVRDLELTVKLLCDVLTERGMLEPNGLSARIAAVQQQLAAEGVAKEQAERERAEAARRAADAKPISCAACGRTVRQRDSFLSANGPVCPSCHSAQE